MVDISSPPLSAQRADLVGHQGLLLEQAGGREVGLGSLSTPGFCHIHHTSSKIQHEPEPAQSLCVLLLQWREKCGVRFKYKLGSMTIKANAVSFVLTSIKVSSGSSGASKVTAPSRLAEMGSVKP